jgi:hypothetical protein
MSKLPVLFITFTKVEPSLKVFETIKQYKPTQLFIAQDGPRISRPDDVEKIERVRQIETLIDWPCQVLTTRSDVNLGVKVRIETALDWFFSHISEGIILEDDTVPSPDFYTFCEELIEKYREDQRVYLIGGSNFNIDPKTDYSYFFSSTPLIWGWATWADRWHKYESDLTTIQKTLADKSFGIYYPDPYRREHEQERIELLLNDKIPAWDYRWAYTLQNQHGLCAVPAKNLVCNIGFGLDATNTFDPDHRHASLFLEPLDWPLKHPSYLNKSFYWEETLFYPGQDMHRYHSLAEISQWAWRKVLQKFGFRY